MMIPMTYTTTTSKFNLGLINIGTFETKSGTLPLTKYSRGGLNLSKGFTYNKFGFSIAVSF
jgi:hypothetical protein